MNLYLEDDSVDGVLLRLLDRAGHNVQLPQDVGTSGESDPVHLTFAARSRRVLLSRNHDDFRELHELVHYTFGTHAGILIVCYDNDARRDLTQKGIVLAANLLSAGAPIDDGYSIRIWDVATANELHEFKGHHAMLVAVEFLADGKTVASAAYDGTVKLWDVSQWAR